MRVSALQRAQSGATGGGFQAVLMQRFGEPLHVFEGSPTEIRCALTDRQMRLRQEVDIGSSAEVALGARLMQLSAHGKNRCVLPRQAVGAIGGNSRGARRAAGTISGTILGTAGFPQVEASRILRVLDTVRWPRG